MSFRKECNKQAIHSIRQRLNLFIKSYINQHHDSLQKFAMNPCAYHMPPFPLLMKHLVDSSDGRMSLFTSLKEYREVPEKVGKRRRYLRGTCRGSLTVEAAAVLPMMLFFFLTFFAFFHTLEMQTKADVILSETAKELAMYGYDSEDASTLLNAAYVEARLVSGYSKSELEVNGVRGGHAGFVLLGSEFPSDDSRIKIRLTYAIKNQFPFFSRWDIYGGNCQSARVWNGYHDGDAGETKEQDAKESETVYMTENGTVYHRNPNCAYLNPSIKSVSPAAAAAARNRSGGTYKPCERCPKTAGTTVYITSYGDRYHSSIDCSGLKRTIYAVPIDEVNCRGCSKCGGGK